jgi:hypothetical protein
MCLPLLVLFSKIKAAILPGESCTVILCRKGKGISRAYFNANSALAAGGKVKDV